MQGGSRALADMKRIWLSRKFSYIYEARPSSNLTFFMQTLYSQSIGEREREAFRSFCHIDIAKFQ